MKLKLKYAIRVNGQQYRAPAVIDTEELEISDTEAEVLISSGAAELHNDVVDGPVEGRLAGVADGTVRELGDMKKDDLVRVATEMGIGTDGKTKAELIAAIEAAPVVPGDGQ